VYSEPPGGKYVPACQLAIWRQQSIVYRLSTFHTTILMPTKLIVTVDTEEEGLWSNSFQSSGNTVNNVQGVPAFQSICENHKLAPVYLINSPVIEDQQACELLKEINDRDTCEIGCHIHPWNTPPVEENTTAYRSYLCNLDTDIQKSKLEQVTTEIHNRFGKTPTSFRAGRYGLDLNGASFLEDLGYKVDSSVCPFTDYSADGGPDFRGYPWKPYYIGDKFNQPAEHRTDLLEVPVSFGFNWKQFDSAFRLDETLGTPIFNKLRLRGILSRLNILKKIKFSPEKHSSQDLQILADIYSSQNAPALVMMFHSSSLQPGYSPYVKSKEDLTEFLRTIDSVIDYCLNTLDMESATLESFGEFYASSTSATPPSSH
jgi:hypothetical protein